MVPGHEMVGKVVEVGSEVSKFKVGDTVGVGLLVGCCNCCHPCAAEAKQYCNKKIWSYNDVYTDGIPTQGGFSGTVIVHQKFVVKIPEGLSPEQAAPLLCAGVTVYSPLRHFGLKKSGLRGSVLGLGGVGHIGVLITEELCQLLAFFMITGNHRCFIDTSSKEILIPIPNLY